DPRRRVEAALVTPTLAGEYGGTCAQLTFLRKDLPRILSESLHRADIGNRAVADARDTKLGQAPRRRYAFHDHYIDGERNAIADPADQRIVPQARNEEAGRSCGGIGFRAVESVVNGACRVAWLTQKQVCPRIDKEV